MLPTRRRPVRLLPRGVRAALGLSLRLGDVPRHPDGHDRRGRGRLREVSRRALARRSPTRRGLRLGPFSLSAPEALRDRGDRSSDGVERHGPAGRHDDAERLHRRQARGARGARDRRSPPGTRGAGVVRRPVLAGASLRSEMRHGHALARSAAAMVGPLFSQSAWNNVTFAGEEVRDPGRTLPFALLVGCLVVTCLYVLDERGLSEGARARRHPATRRQDRVGTAAAERLFGPVGGGAMAAAIWSRPSAA